MALRLTTTLLIFAVLQFAAVGSAKTEAPVETRKPARVESAPENPYLEIMRLYEGHPDYFSSLIHELGLGLSPKRQFAGHSTGASRSVEGRVIPSLEHERLKQDRDQWEDVGPQGFRWSF